MTETTKRFILKGTPASSGLAYGEARVIYRWRHAVEERAITGAEVEKEYSRLDNAIARTLEELGEYRRSAGQKIGGPVARIFDSQILIASDQDFLRKVKSEIRKTRKNSEYIYSMMVEKNIMPLRRSEDEYMRQMVLDIEAVLHRVLHFLAGESEPDLSKFAKDRIFVGKIFTPAEVLSLYECGARAIITTGGSPNSHMALIARSLIIPTVIDARRAHLRIRSGDQLIVDGDSGQIIVNPSEVEWKRAVKASPKLRELPLTRLKKLPKVSPVTKDNVTIDVAANINLPGPLDRILSNHKIGVGLYRTEFFYLQQGKFPSEDSQFDIYDSIAESYYPQSVVIRTFDLGSDKINHADNYGKEDNPALGWRGIRITLEKPQIFKEQIRAILKASTRKNVKILLPMITDISELKKALALIRRSMAELKRKSIDFDEKIPVGIMIEVPSAAISADTLAGKVSFLSIGSNDLTQYTLAADRDNKKLVRIFNPLHPAVLRLIKMTVDAGKKHNIPITVCGEMSGDALAIPLLIGLGIDELSMNPSRLHNAYNVIPRLTVASAKKLANEIMKLNNLKDIEGRLLEFNLALE